MADTNENEVKAETTEKAESVRRPPDAETKQATADAADDASPKVGPSLFKNGEGLDLLSTFQYPDQDHTEALTKEEKGSRITRKTEVRTIYHDGKTVLELFQRGIGLNTGRPCVKVIEKTIAGILTQEHFYQDIWEEAAMFAQGIIELGIQPGNDTHMGIQSINCPQRLAGELGCFMNNMVVTPFHRTFTEEWHQVEIAIAHRLPMLLVYDFENLDPYLDHIEKMQNLRLIVIIKTDTIPQDLMVLADRCNVRLVWYEDVINKTKRDRILKANPVHAPTPSTPSHPTPKDIAFVFMSHGASSKPKCCSFTHEQVVAAAMNLLLIIHCGGKMSNGTDILISDLYKSLPLGVLLEYVVYMHGSTVVYTRQSFHEYIEDLLSVKPTIVHILPSSLQRLHHIVVDRKKSPCAKWALKKTIENKMIALNEKKVMKRICLECMGSLRGGFPNSYKFTKVGLTSGDYLEVELMGFARSLFSSYFTQIYGTAETLGLGAHALPLHHPHFPVVGPPAPSCVIKLTPSDGIPGTQTDGGMGLVCIKAPFAADSYQICVPTAGDPTNPSLKVVKQQDFPFVKTNDIAKWGKSNELQLLGRLEDIVKIPGGFLSLAKMESLYRSSKFVAQICVVGIKNESPLIGLVYPDKEMLKVWVQKNKDATAREQVDKELQPQKGGSEETFKRKPNIEEIIMDDLKQIGTLNKLHVGVKALRVSLQPFCPWNGQPRRYLMLELYGEELNPIFDSVA